MSPYSLNTPVALIIFNRPDNTAQVFEAIRQAQPPLLLVAADGPRSNHPGEAAQCAATRAIIEQVDWDCKVLTDYSDTNMGMKRRESSAFDWIFATVEEAIILEDDCLPHPSFFRYCEELLNYYRHDSRIMTISGDNTPLGFKNKRNPHDSYYFSIYPRTWGWATWRRAWQHYDINMTLWPQIRDEQWLKDILQEENAIRCWKQTFQSCYDGFETWDFQWILSSWLQGGLTIIPHHNLMTNLGFGAAATNTLDVQSPRSHVPTQAMTFPLQHPAWVVPDRLADAFTQDNVYDYSRLAGIRRRVHSLLKG
jgi:hypothetical protein